MYIILLEGGIYNQKLCLRDHPVLEAILILRFLDKPHQNGKYGMCGFYSTVWMVGGGRIVHYNLSNISPILGIRKVFEMGFSR